MGHRAVRELARRLRPRRRSHRLPVRRQRRDGDDSARPRLQVPFAERIRWEAGIPTGAVGLITEPRRRTRSFHGGRPTVCCSRASCCAIRIGRSARHMSSVIAWIGRRSTSEPHRTGALLERHWLRAEAKAKTPETRRREKEAGENRGRREEKSEKRRPAHRRRISSNVPYMPGTPSSFSFEAMSSADVSGLTVWSIARIFPSLPM